MSAAQVRASADGKAIVVSDADPTDQALIRNARDVLKYSGEVLAGPDVTAREARFAARELSRCLRDMLDIVDPQEDGQ